MPVATIQLPDGRTADVEIPEGMSQQDMQAQLQSMFEQGAFDQAPQAPAPAAPTDVPTPGADVPAFAQPQAQPVPEPTTKERINQAILAAPGGPAAVEFASAVNRGVVNLLDFLAPDQINAALELAGSETRVPTLGEQPTVQAAATGEFMEPGLAREAVRTAGEFVGPAAGFGQALRTAAKTIPAAATPTVREGVIQTMAGKPLPEMAGAAVAGAGTEVGEEVGREIGGEEGAQIGRLAGGILAPISLSLAKETGRALATQGAKKLLKEAAPTIEGLKQAARGVFKEIDDLGVTVNPGGLARLSDSLKSTVRAKGFNPTIHPKVSAALKEFEAAASGPKTLSELDVLRRVAGSAARSTEPDEARLGRLLTDKIDDFLDTAGKAELSKTSKDIGTKYKDARQLWRRAKKAEILEEAFSKADLQATGFENGIRTQFRSILNNKSKSRGFTKEELDAMKQVVKGTTMQNMAKMLGRFGFSEGQASNMLMGSLGVAGGAAAGGPAGAVAVPLLGQLSRNLAQKLTRKGAEGADLIVKAGNNGIDVVKAYMKAVPAKERTAQELAELLLRPNISLESLKQAIKSGPQSKNRLLNDAAFLVTSIKASQEGEQ